MKSEYGKEYIIVALIEKVTNLLVEVEILKRAIKYLEKKK